MNIFSRIRCPDERIIFPPDSRVEAKFINPELTVNPLVLVSTGVDVVVDGSVVVCDVVVVVVVVVDGDVVVVVVVVMKVVNFDAGFKNDFVVAADLILVVLGVLHINN